MEIFKINEIDNQTFYMVPKALFSNEKYKNLSLDAKLVYSILRDRMSLSRKNGWYNENGEIYLIFKRDHLANIVGCCIKTIVKVLQELVRYELIIDKQVGLNKANQIYICHVELPYVDTKIPQNTEDIRSCKNYKSRAVKAASQDLYFLQPNNTNVNNTDTNKTTTNETDVIVLLEKHGIKSIAANNLINHYGVDQIQQQLVNLKAQEKK